MKTIKIAAACMTSAAAMCLPAAGNAAVLFTQASANSGANASQNDTGGGNGNFATVYDDFNLTSSATITGVEFTGIFFNPPQIGNITGFTVQFYATNAGQPGGSLLSSFTSGNGSQNCTGTTCTYSLGTNFAANAGTTYWLSIVPDLAFPPQWGWARGVGGNSSGYHDFLGTRSQVGTDFAFTLTGAAAAVPEPSAWALLILGFGLVGGSMRSKRSRKATYAYA